MWRSLFLCSWGWVVGGSQRSPVPLPTYILHTYSRLDGGKVEGYMHTLWEGRAPGRGSEPVTWAVVDEVRRRFGRLLGLP